MSPETVRRIINGQHQPERTPIEASLDFLSTKLAEQRALIDQEKAEALQKVARQYGWTDGGTEDAKDTKFLDMNTNYQLDKKSLEDKFAQRYQALQNLQYGADQIRAAYPKMAKLNQLEAQITNANTHAKETVRRATKYVQDVKEYAANQRQELEKRVQQYETQVQAREQKIKDYIAQGITFLRAFVDKRIDFALELAANRKTDEALIQDLQQAKAAANDEVKKMETEFLHLSQITEALTFGQEDTKRYRQIEEQMADIENLLKAHPLEILDISPTDVPPSNP